MSYAQLNRRFLRALLKGCDLAGNDMNHVDVTTLFQPDVLVSLTR